MEWSTLNGTSISFPQESGIIEKVEQNGVRGKRMGGNIGRDRGRVFCSETLLAGYHRVIPYMNSHQV